MGQNRTPTVAQTFSYAPPTQSPSQPTAESPSQGPIASGGPIVALSWYATPGASATNTAMNKPGVAAALAVPMPFRGSVIGIAVSGTAAKAGGTARFDVRSNGTKIDGLFLSWDNVQRDVERFVEGQYGFVRDDYLDVVFTTNSTYTPTSTVVEVILWVTQDTTEII